jgi:hypothetical protein
MKNVGVPLTSVAVTHGFLPFERGCLSVPFDLAANAVTDLGFNAPKLRRHVNPWVSEGWINSNMN